MFTKAGMWLGNHPLMQVLCWSDRVRLPWITAQFIIVVNIEMQMADELSQTGSDETSRLRAAVFRTSI
jgi:hypothetical protein